MEKKNIQYDIKIIKKCNKMQINLKKYDYYFFINITYYFLL